MLQPFPARWAGAMAAIRRERCERGPADIDLTGLAPVAQTGPGVEHLAALEARAFAARTLKLPIREARREFDRAYLRRLVETHPTFGSARLAERAALADRGVLLRLLRRLGLTTPRETRTER